MGGNGSANEIDIFLLTFKLNSSNAESTFVQSTRMQKSPKTMAYWYSWDSYEHYQPATLASRFPIQPPQLYIFPTEPSGIGFVSIP